MGGFSTLRSGRRSHSIRARLSLVFLFLFLLMIILGLESLRTLSSVNEASAQIRMRWLPNTRALGDLNNFTTDFPPVEAALLRADKADERAAVKRQMKDLDHSIISAQNAYRQVVHDTEEKELYTQFDRSWSKYRGIVERYGAATPDAAGSEVMRELQMSSKAAYDAASSALTQLTDHNLASAREASEQSERTYGQARSRIVLTILVTGLLVAAAMFYVRRFISEPLVDLAMRMHRLAASETSLHVHGTQRPDEIGEMARAVVVFRNNAIDLAANRLALSQQAAMLQEKLAEEQRVTLLQRNFVSMASHEFRTPLAIIDGHAQRLVSMRDRLTPVALTERARKIRDAVGRMTQLIDNLIGSARSIDGHIGLRSKPAQFDLTALLLEVCQQQRELTPTARILEPVGPQPVLLSGDAVLLTQVFGNLVSNAVKYSPHDGSIHLSVEVEADHVIVVIEDQGIGIPQKEQHRVFERYYRGSNTSGIVGSGVGLYLVKTIVDLHHGTVGLSSGEGAGTRFEVRLPSGRVSPG